MNGTMRGVAGWWLSIFFFSAAIGGSNPPAAAPVAGVRPLLNATLSPALKAAAERDGIDLNTKTSLEGSGATGDAVVAWIGARNGARLQQWLIQFKRGSGTPAELRSHLTADVTKYLSWGSVVTFQSEVEPIDLWIAGPVETGSQKSGNPSASPTVRRTRVFVPAAYLRLGLDGSERVNQQISRRVKEIKKEDPTFSARHLYALEKPVKQENVAYAKPVAERVGFTPEMERAWMGGYVALQTFYTLANDEPTLREIAEIALEKPPVWKLAKLAFGAHFLTSFGGSDPRPIDPGAFGLLPVGLASYEVPYSFSFANNLIVSGWMVVTAPSPPLDVAAGILALTAFHPKDPGRAIEVMLISSTPATVNGSKKP